MIEQNVDGGLDEDLDYITAISTEVNKIIDQLPKPTSDYRGEHVLLREEVSRAHDTVQTLLKTSENLMKVQHVAMLIGNAVRHELMVAQEGESEKAEEETKNADESVDATLKEWVDNLGTDYGGIIVNLQNLLQDIKAMKGPVRGVTPRPLDTQRPSRTPTPVQPLNIGGRHSPAPHSRPGSVAPLSPRSTGFGLPAQQQLSALDRAKLRNQQNQGGSFTPY